MKLKTLAFIAASSAMSVSAYAQTEYNLPVSNTANLSYTSGTDARTATSEVVTFNVDRKVTFNLSGPATADKTVVPGDTTTSVYTLTNNSNAPVDYAITPPAETNVTYIIDANNNGVVDTGETTITNGDTPDLIALSTADGATPSVSIIVQVVTAANAVDGDSTTYSLQATAVEPTGSTIGTPGTGIVPTDADAEWTPLIVQTIVDNSADNANNQGILRTETGTFTVGAAIIALTKAVKVISDPITDVLLLTDPTAKAKAIPGAIVQYTLTVMNTGSAPATVQLTDLLSENFTNTATAASVLIDGNAPTTTPTVTVDSGTTGYDALLTIPDVTVVAFDDDYQANNLGDSEASTVVTFEVVLK
tara:strand:- start:364 stop:1449 length:1086 start_codon:yes stop_codon:yes gene_type:complete